MSDSLEIKPDSLENIISASFRNFFTSYSSAFNKQNRRKGSVFEPRFKRNRIDSNDYLKACISYIHLNPVLHSYAKHFKNWKYSSYNSYFSNKSTCIAKNQIIPIFDDLDNFKYYHGQRLFEKISEFNNLPY